MQELTAYILDLTAINNDDDSSSDDADNSMFEDLEMGVAGRPLSGQYRAGVEASASVVGERTLMSVARERTPATEEWTPAAGGVATLGRETSPRDPAGSGAPPAGQLTRAGEAMRAPRSSRKSAASR